MSFNIPVLLLYQLSELAAHGGKGIPNDGGQLFVQIAFAGFARHNYLVFGRNRDIDPYAKRITASLMLLWFFYGDATADDVIAYAIKLDGLLADKILDS